MSDYTTIDNITIDRGETFEYIFSIEIDGELLVLDGYLIYAQIREYASRDSALIAEFNVTVDDQAVPNPATTNSEVRLYFDQDETISTPFLENSEGWYDVLFVSPGGERTIYLAGRVNVDGTVSQEA